MGQVWGWQCLSWDGGAESRGGGGGGGRGQQNRGVGGDWRGGRVGVGVGGGRGVIDMFYPLTILLRSEIPSYKCHLAYIMPSGICHLGLAII